MNAGPKNTFQYRLSRVGALPGQSIGFQAGLDTPAYETNRQQNGVSAWAKRSEIQQKQITEERRVNGGLKNTFRCKLSGAGTERERDTHRETETRESERQRERQRDNSLLDARACSHKE